MKSSFDRAVAFTSFEGEARELVHLLKYDGVRPAARPLGSMLARAILKLRDELSGASRPVLLVPVPLHAARQRLRRFNQTDLIARVAVAELGRHFPEATLEYAPKVLVRKRDTPSQSGLSNHQRRANLRAVFAVTAPERLRDRAVVLVDDVFTTGATAEECSRSLKRAGAKDVYVATVARSFKFSQAELDRWHFRTQSATHTGALPAQVAAHPKM